MYVSIRNVGTSRMTDKYESTTIEALTENEIVEAPLVPRGASVDRVGCRATTFLRGYRRVLSTVMRYCSTVFSSTQVAGTSPSLHNMGVNQSLWRH